MPPAAAPSSSIRWSSPTTEPSRRGGGSSAASRVPARFARLHAAHAIVRYDESWAIAPAVALLQLVRPRLRQRGPPHLVRLFTLHFMCPTCRSLHMPHRTGYRVGGSPLALSPPLAPTSPSTLPPARRARSEATPATNTLTYLQAPGVPLCKGSAAGEAGGLQYRALTRFIAAAATRGSSVRTSARARRAARCWNTTPPTTT